MSIKLVSDSTCDLPKDWLEQSQVEIVPINIQFGAESFQEGINLSVSQFFQKIAESGTLPQTSQPSIGQFLNVYQKLSPHCDDILSIHVMDKLSGTCQNAKTAAQTLADEVNVYVIDSGAGSAGLGWMVHKAARLIKAGQSAPEIVQSLEADREQISIYFALDNLQFAQMSGRVGRMQSVLSSLLNIKPIIGLNQGLINVEDKVRSQKSALQRIVKLTQQKVQDRAVHVGIIHAEAPALADTLADLAHNALNVQDMFIHPLALSLIVHFGPDTVGLVSYPAS